MGEPFVPAHAKEANPLTSPTLPPEADDEKANEAHHEEIRAHFASKPQNILIAEDGSRVETTESIHRVCGQDYIDLFRRAPDFACFSDGCGYECCGCGRCCAPEQCSETGKGHVWHQ